ncbi:hypothetical protein TBLA_0H03630 [Henningerozyma blattae CBS 6284]|uniref:Uncharacterized protein n=1 Tax=Henningerozyma blattae (strain ATCC 34711 / CBS 6284 / DSM 70876 / NBRC 10599 / NRRL Y-10934 / UCD 77-7) TaxID=1071380 RepID=I2H8E3_HENB6|nr:hypothetical protein TBLA_0H03630 [Tetrapisispora blattae CBS 6284]CCH62645.1 hypothetical protein TBLA_0H03630 [Tetrapisispora blattae CBS 6284]
MNTTQSSQDSDNSLKKQLSMEEDYEEFAEEARQAQLYGTIPRTIPNNDPYSRVLKKNSSGNKSGSKSKRKSNKKNEGPSADQANYASEIENDNTSLDDNSSPRVLSSQHNVDSQDRLWSEIDVLDDVKRLAAQTSAGTTNTFPGELEPQLIRLREAHTNLLKTMRDHHNELVERATQAERSNGSAPENASPTITGIATGGTSVVHSGAAAGPAVTASEDRYIEELISIIRELRG